ncbi:MAG: type 2 isopentenyl-diphosphate Delta-isomerase [Ignavibacteriales bacterium]|nr:MAG: type 2 isopentenyl-diphosphate Delta-isomerase [Ignavibacteriales bacterium]
MTENPDLTSKRKQEHIELCLTDKVAFINKTNGFEKYEFIHDAVTEVEIEKINLSTKFFSKKIDYPFIISCMTGGTGEAENINSQLAEAANQLNIVLGVGSQRQALENQQYHHSYKVIRERAPGIPLLGNIGAAQVVLSKSLYEFQVLVDLVEADAFVVHLNPLQELLQPEGEIFFKGLRKKITKLVKALSVPVIIKEVGSGISYSSAKKMLECGVKGIDVSGAGGTSWAGVEILRQKTQSEKNHFWDWGLPTSYCINEVQKLKKKYSFYLVGSGGISTAEECAKAIALGADMTASARPILQALDKTGVDGVTSLIKSWFEDLKKIMFLTGSKSIKDFQKNKLIRREVLY